MHVGAQDVPPALTCGPFEQDVVGPPEVLDVDEVLPELDPLDVDVEDVELPPLQAEIFELSHCALSMHASCDSV